MTPATTSAEWITPETSLSRWYKKYTMPALLTGTHEDAEPAHRKVMRVLERADGISPLLALSRLAFRADPMLRMSALGLNFSGPFGLAAGFTKGTGLCTLAACGFSHIEFGGITLEGQPGNDGVRLLRSRDGRTVWNFKGFDNPGATATREALARKGYWRKPRVPLFLNVGKGKNTPLEKAPREYAKTLNELWDFADAVTLNPSSPNTPGLRALLRKDLLEELVICVQAMNRAMSASSGDRARYGRRERLPLPLGIKLSPDMADEELSDAFNVCAMRGVDYIVLVNTTVRHAGYHGAFPADRGGVSGEYLKARAQEVLSCLSPAAKRQRITLIGIGGIHTGKDIYERIRAGATLCQGLSAWPLEGPDWVRRLNRDLALRLRADGFQCVAEAIGTR